MNFPMLLPMMILVTLIIKPFKPVTSFQQYSFDSGLLPLVHSQHQRPPRQRQFRFRWNDDRRYSSSTILSLYKQQQHHVRPRTSFNRCPTTTTTTTTTRLFSQPPSSPPQPQPQPQPQVAATAAFQQQQHHTPSLSSSTSILPPVPNNAHRIVLMRHGESEFNNANVFTGWCDVALTPRGIVEAVEAGQVFASHNISFRKCYASLLTRSIVTAQRTLEAAGASYTPIQYDWRFNERHYGALQGLGKERTADRLGRNIVMEWRRSYQARPPLMTEEHPHYDIIYNDPRYRHIAKYVQLPIGESLEDCQFRVVAAWNDVLLDLASTYQNDDPSSYSFIVAHANSLRSLVMHLDDIPVKDIESLNIPTAIPFFYDISTFTGKVMSKENVPDSGVFRGTYISDESKKRNFLERRRAANDPFLWALHDHEVTEQMLVGSATTTNSIANQQQREPEGLNGLEEEAKRNTELFSSALKANRNTNTGTGSNQY